MTGHPSCRSAASFRCRAPAPFLLRSNALGGHWGGHRVGGTHQAPTTRGRLRIMLTIACQGKIIMVGGELQTDLEANVPLRVFLACGKA